MANNNPSIVKQSIKFGVIQACLSILHSITLNITDINLSKKTNTLVNLLILIIPIFYGIYKYKNTNNGFLKLKEAIKVGFIISLIGIMITMIWIIFEYNVLEPGKLDQLMDKEKDEILLNNMDKSFEEINRSIEFAKKFSVPGYLGSSILVIAHIFSGLIISLIVGAVIHKKKEL
ncbi:DUF4199 domain-containing protein [Aquimarina sp. AD10]|uniref:DUF4199 domain-containing protein n=1 Tax=Aquimarina sp. AD10 TaxID=1714849 RepID=UPI000E4FABAF|nr:DUF4199 domain-containing protein [Aquimarina sp. AD10]AXT60185.1 DUF4199 domain-containing protein [Aquimarina sp. AD10]RKN00022.1 DUF4199 family protein [Aquimarina sp. AD10]